MMFRSFVLASLAIFALNACGTQDPTAAMSALKASETRNGGYGVVISGKLVSLDLAMRNVHDAPYVSEGVANTLTPDEVQVVRYYVEPVSSPAVTAIVLAKLSEMRGRLADAGAYLPVGHLIEAMATYTWVPSDAGLECLDVHDDDSPYPNKKQVAYRYQSTIRFCRDFGFLDAGNQAAVIVHELVYAALAEKSVLIDFVGFLFSPSFQSFTAPARSEMRRHADTLGTKLATPPNHWAVVTRVGSVAPDVAASWNVPVGWTACFGEAELPPKGTPGWLLWGSDSGCSTGETKLGKNSVVLPTDTAVPGQLKVGDHPVGRIGGSAGELGALCTGVYSGLCALVFAWDGWYLSFGSAADDIHEAAAAGNLERLQYFLANGVSIDARNADGQTPLMIAAKAKQAVVAEWLVERGAALEMTDDQSMKALAHALNAKAHEIVGLLAAKGADVNYGRPLLGLIGGPNPWQPCDVAMIRALLRSPTIDVNSGDPFANVVTWGHTDCVEAFLQTRVAAGLDLRASGYLAIAAENGRSRIFEILVEIPEVDPNVSGRGGGSNSRVAACTLVDRADLTSLALLLRRDDLMLDDPKLCYWETPLHTAVRVRSLPAVKMLLARGAKTDTFSYLSGAGDDYAQPLMAAARAGADAIVAELIRAGAPLDPTTHRYKWTPATYAVGGRHLTTLKLLYEADHAINLGPALCAAKLSEFAEIVAYLESVGAVCVPTTPS